MIAISQERMSELRVRIREVSPEVLAHAVDRLLQQCERENDPRLSDAMRYLYVVEIYQLLIDGMNDAQR
jgi:hypothetical protein